MLQLHSRLPALYEGEGSIDVPGPNLPLRYTAAVQQHRNGHSCITQHFEEQMPIVRTFQPFAARAVWHDLVD